MDSVIAVCPLYAFSRICLCDTVILIVQADIIIIIITIIVMVIIIYTKSFLIKYLFITDYQVKRRLTL